MKFQSASGKLILAASVFLATSITADVVRVDVGKAPLTFTPEIIEADVGDYIEFRFHPQAHSVVLGDYSRPCAPAEMHGFYSGFVPVSAGSQSERVFRVRVDSTDPMFFYCSQGNHCPQGMVGAINPSGNQTLSAYAQNAVGRPVFSPVPDHVFGGQFVHPSRDDGYSDDDDETETATGTSSSTSTASPSATAGSGNGSDNDEDESENGNESGASGLLGQTVGAVFSFMIAVAFM